MQREVARKFLLRTFPGRCSSTAEAKFLQSTEAATAEFSVDCGRGRRRKEEYQRGTDVGRETACCPFTLPTCTAPCSQRFPSLGAAWLQCEGSVCPSLLARVVM